MNIGFDAAKALRKSVPEWPGVFVIVVSMRLNERPDKGLGRAGRCQCHEDCNRHAEPNPPQPDRESFSIHPHSMSLDKRTHISSQKRTSTNLRFAGLS